MGAEITQADGRSAQLVVLAGTSTTLPTESTPAAPIITAPQRTWRSGFDAVVASGPDTAFLTAVANGAGIAVSQAGGSLVITTGTTAYSETILRSVPSWYGSLKSRYSLQLSQRIANCEVYLELVDVIGDGLTIVHTNSTTVIVTIPNNTFTAANVGQSLFIGAISVASSLNQRAAIASVSGNDVTFTGAGFAASGTGTCSLFGWNYHHVYYDGTTNTTTKYGTQRNGWQTADITATINPTASPGHVGSMIAEAAKATYFDQLSASSLGVELMRRASSVRNVPEDQTTLRFQVRVRNLAVAPASTTTVTIGFLELDQYIPQQVSIVSVEAQSINQALGVEIVANYEKRARTYSASTSVAAAAAATDIFTLTGSASATIYVTRVIVSGIQTTAGLADVQLIKYSTADTGGTSGAVTAVPHDSLDAAATATCLAYTANPTTGAAVGTFRRGYVPVAGATSVVNPVVTFDFGDKGKAVILRGIAQLIAVNLGGATLTGGTFDISIEWYEV
jgi:hypothetical protein